MNRMLTLIAAGALTLALALPAAFAQNADTKPADAKSTENSSPEAHPRSWACDPHHNPNNDCVVKTYFLSNTYEQNDANEILIALRNLLDTSSKMYLVMSRRAINVYGPPDQQAAAQNLITELDRPQRTWRLTYTLAESDGGKRLGVQHFAIVVADGQRTVLKQGNKIPVMTGIYDAKGDAGSQTQFQYLDIGMNFDATIQDLPTGLYLKTKVEQSSLADEHMSGPLAAEPILRQTSLEGTSAITPGKPLTLGSVDVAGSTRHIDIEVVAEPIS